MRLRAEVYVPQAMELDASVLSAWRPWLSSLGHSHAAVKEWERGRNGFDAPDGGGCMGLQALVMIVGQLLASVCQRRAFSSNHAPLGRLVTFPRAAPHQKAETRGAAIQAQHTQF